jgi:hypothetical protein
MAANPRPVGGSGALLLGSAALGQFFTFRPLNKRQLSSAEADQALWFGECLFRTLHRPGPSVRPTHGQRRPRPAPPNAGTKHLDGRLRGLGPCGVLPNASAAACILRWLPQRSACRRTTDLWCPSASCHWKTFQTHTLVTRSADPEVKFAGNRRLRRSVLKPFDQVVWQASITPPRAAGP